MATITKEQLIQKLKNVQACTVPSVKRGMKKAVLNGEGQAKINCTPGKGPYGKAPYSDDKDVAREGPHMRDVMYGKVFEDAERIVGVIGNPKSYSGYVHEGTKRMGPRPFILDAIKEKEEETLQFLGDSLGDAISDVCNDRPFVDEVPDGDVEE